MSQRKHLTGEQKAIILRELLENNVSLSELAEKYQVQINLIRRWNKVKSKSKGYGFEQPVEPHQLSVTLRAMVRLKSSTALLTRNA